MFKCLLIRNSSRILSLVFVSVSCHKVGLELLSIAMRTPVPLAYCIIASTFSKSILLLMSRRMLAKIILTISIINSRTPISSSESCFISKVSTRLLVTTKAARILPSPDENILYFFYRPAILV